MDPDKWEACDPNDNSGVMISNLPLLFVNGMPTALPFMSVGDFEKFIPFMVRCSTGEESSVPWSQLPRPPWWPSRLPFRITSNSTTNRNLMVRIVERCYSYHGCPYLLQFCSSLIDVMPSSGYRFTDNRDGTSSMYHGTTGKLLVTFRNENRDYDKKLDLVNDSQKKLISSIHHGKDKKRNIMVQPPVSDVYLCDKCDDDFLSLKEVQNHEKQCEGNLSVTTFSIPSPEPEFIDDIICDNEQVPFLSLFGLQPTKHSGKKPHVSPRKNQHPIKIAYFNQFPFDAVDISSPFGRKMLARLRKYWKLELAQHNVMRYERYIHAPLENYEPSKTRHSSRWIVTFRPKRKTGGWTHVVCFTREEKNERRRTIATGLTERSRHLLSKCNPVVIKLKRLQQKGNDEGIKPREISKPIPLIDLCLVNGTSTLTNTEKIIRIPIKDPLSRPSTNIDMANEACQRVLNCKTVTVTRLCRPSSILSPSKEAVNGDRLSSPKDNSSFLYKNDQIEIIDLLSDDDDAPINGTVSKNGHSHWLAQNSFELGRSSKDLTSGSLHTISSPYSDDEKRLSAKKIETDCITNKVILSNKENLKSEYTVSSSAITHIDNESSGQLNTCSNNLELKLIKRQRSEVLRLKSDECRELNKKGLHLLHDFNGGSRKILTRRLAKKKLPTLTTRNSQFVIKPLLKKQILLESLHKSNELPKKFSDPKRTILDENGNSKDCACPKRAKTLFQKKKVVVGLKRKISHSYGRTVVKRPRLIRELLSLSQDECKEIRCKGFHPADVIRVVNDVQCRDIGTTKNLHSMYLKPSSYYVKTKKLYSEINLLAIDENIREASDKNNLYGQLYLMKDRQYASHVQDLVNWKLTSNTRPQVVPPIQKENPRRTHRQLIRSQSGMCVLSYHLPQFR